MAKKTAAPNTETETPDKASKARVGTAERDMVIEGLDRIAECCKILEAAVATMKKQKITEIELDGPKALARGVNEIQTFAIKLDGALKKSAMKMRMK